MVLYLILGLIDIIRGSGVSETMIASACSLLEAVRRIEQGINEAREKWEVGCTVPRGAFHGGGELKLARP